MRISDWSSDVCSSDLAQQEEEEEMNATISPAEADYAVLSDTDTVRLQRVLPGPIERVWQHLTDAGLRRQWLAGGDDVQPRAGTSFELGWRNAELHDPPGHHPYGSSADRRGGKGGG